MISFYFKEALKSLNRAKLASLVTLITTAIAVLFLFVSLFSSYLCLKYSDSLLDKVRMNLFVSDTLRSEDISAIRTRLQSDRLVRSVQFIDKEHAREKFLKDTGEDFKELLDGNPLPASFSISFKAEKISPQCLHQKISSFEKIPGVTDLVFDYDFLMKALNFVAASQFIVILVSCFLILIAVYLVYSTDRLIIHSRMKTFETMKLIGTKLKDIKMPVYLAGTMLGAASGMLSSLLLIIVSMFISSAFPAIDFHSLYFVVISLNLAAGSALGFLGSIAASMKISLKINNIAG